MAKRNLCYKHHCQEFDKLANHDRHLAADWRTVEPCELCQAERADLRAALDRMIDVYEVHFEPLEDEPKGAYTQARAALAAERGGEVDDA